MSDDNKKTFGFKEWIKDVIELIKDNKRIVITVIVFIILLVSAVLISGHFARRSKEATAVLDTQETAATETYAIPDEPLKQDAYPEINNLMKKYYASVADGDIAAVENLRTGLDDKERIVIEKKAQYVENYPNITCYTKPGPVDKSYLVYVNYDVKLNDFDELIPGMNVWYVCVDESGRYYINEDPQDDKIIEYCKIVSVQDDVQDLSNTINVKYNELMESDPDLGKFMDELGVQMKVDVGEELAKAEAPAEEPTPTPTPTPEAAQEQATVEVKTVKAITVVNVRASDSEKADKVGKASEGQEFKLLEEKANGWSKIEFEGKDAFIKSEYLETVGTQTVSADASEEGAASTNDNDGTKTESTTGNNTQNNSGKSTTENSEAAKNSPSSGTGTATDTVKVREKPSTESDQLGTVYGGEKLEIVEKQSDGWTKVKYKKGYGYVKSEFLR